MPKELTWQEAIERVLAESPIPLHYSEIADRIIGGGLPDQSGRNTCSYGSGGNHFFDKT